MNLTYSVVIRTFNEEEHIAKLLTGIYAQTVRPKQVIIVDSGSSDATVSIASRYPVKIVHIKKDEFTFGRALNRGCAEVTSDIICIASAHVYPLYSNWIELMLRHFQDDTVMVVYGAQRGDDTTPYSERCIMRQWYPHAGARTQEHTFCNNANAAVRHSFWQQLHYDEVLPGLEDVAFAQCVKEKGFRVIYEESAQVVHIHDQTLREIYNRYYREALAFKKIYPQEIFRRRELFFLVSANIVSDLYQALRERVLLKNIFSVFGFRLAQFYGTYRGFNAGKVDLCGLRERLYYPSFKQNMASVSPKETCEPISYTGEYIEKKHTYV